MTIREDYQRARSASEKADRRDAILDAAEAQVSATGADKLTMNALAKAAGVAKGTLYLYFDTKEEVLLALFRRANRRFVDRMRDHVYPGMSDDAYCQLFWDQFQADPNLTVYNAQLGSLIERNVSLDALIEAKREMRHFFIEGLPAIEQALSLKPGQGVVMVIALANLMAGANQSDITPYVDLEALPPDVADILSGFEARSVFLRGATLIFKGLRSEL